MKKLLKRIGKILLGLIVLLLITTAILTIRHDILSKKDAKFLKGAYGENFKLSTGESINYTFYDSPSEDVAVILPGFGCASVHYEFDAVAKGLTDKYKIIMFEPLGVGLSDETKRERTSENYCKELHELMEHLNYKKYTLIGHSIAGLYALKYSEMYPDELKSFVGIDATVPDQINYGPKSTKPKNVYSTYKLMRTFFVNTGIYRVLNELSFKETLKKIPTITSKEDKKKALAIYNTNILSDTQMNEIKNMEQNSKDSISLKFPENIPVLYMLSNENCKVIPEWEKLHKDIITNKDSKVLILNGPHYLHNENLEDVLKTIKEWNY